VFFHQARGQRHHQAELYADRQSQQDHQRIDRKRRVVLQIQDGAAERKEIGGDRHERVCQAACGTGLGLIQVSVEQLEKEFKQYDVSLKEDKNMLDVFETGITFYIDKILRDLVKSNQV
jgi:hydrogenase maturation factor